MRSILRYTIHLPKLWFYLAKYGLRDGWRKWNTERWRIFDDLWRGTPT